MTCGATEGHGRWSLLATTNPGDEVVIFLSRSKESYHPDTLLCGAERRLVTASRAEREQSGCGILIRTSCGARFPRAPKPLS